MTDTAGTTRAQAMTGRGRDILKRGAAMAAPYTRYAPKNPAFLLGAAVLGLAGILAWRNRDKIREKAGPVLQGVIDQGEALRERMPLIGMKDRAPEPPEPMLH